MLFCLFRISECPPAMDGMERFACPSPDRQGRYRCIDDHVLCDGFIDCPDGEDEERQACMFYKTVSRYEYIKYIDKTNVKYGVSPPSLSNSLWLIGTMENWCFSIQQWLICSYYLWFFFHTNTPQFHVSYAENYYFFVLAPLFCI